MSNATAPAPGLARLGTGARSAPVWPVVTITVAATLINLGLFVLGRTVGAVLVLDPGIGEPNHAVLPFDVAWKTAGPLALGAVVAALVARRSRRWAFALVWIAFAIGASAAIFPVLGSHDAATAWIMLGMHVTVTAAAVVIALLIARRAARAGRR